MSTPNQPDEGQDPDQTVFRPRVPEGGLVPPTAPGSPSGPPPPITGIPASPQAPPPGPTGPPSWQQQPGPSGPPSWQQQPGPQAPPSWQQQPGPSGSPSWQQQPGPQQPPSGPPSWQQQPGPQQPPAQQPSWVRSDAPAGPGGQPPQQGQPWADQTIARPGTQPAWQGQQPTGPTEKKTVSRTPVLIGFGVLALVVIGLVVALVLVSLGGGSSSKALAPASASPSTKRSAAVTNGPLRSAADITKYLYVPSGFSAAPAGDVKNRADGLAADAKADTKVDFAVGMAWVDASGNAYIVLVEHFKTAATSQMLSSLPDQAMKGAGASDVQEVNARERVGTLTGTLPGSVDALIRTDVLILAALQNGTHDQVSQYVGKQAALLPGP